VNLGVKFRTAVNGYVTGIRFYKGATNTGTHIVSLWSANGLLLRQATAANETESGWQEVAFVSPVAIQPNTTYVASYHTNAGNYAIDGGYFTAPFTNGVLTALQSQPGNGNGVFLYGATAFPTSSFNASNYWVDVVFATTLPPDTTAPQVVSTSPQSGAKNVAVSTSIRATFSEEIDPATLTSATVEVRDSGGNLVGGTLAYASPTLTATFQPSDPLANSTTYTATLRGGVTGIKDLSGNALAGDVVWTFTTKGPSPPSPTTGPGGPIVVVTNASYPFTVYYAEILRAEGLNEFAVVDIGSVSAASLGNYDVVILGEQPLTNEQVAMFSAWVSAGGNLIAMRPDKKLATLLGVTSQETTLADAYIKIDTSVAPGAGIVGETMQFHGAADVYGVNDASVIAKLYSAANTETPNPGVTVRTVGTLGGQAAAFTYDLARSVVYTRQGNPAWSGQERDGFPVIRSDELFFPDYVDSSKIAIPQADEQQRLFANLIGFLNSDKKPLPKFWYFPRSLKAVVVMTGDDHGTDGMTGTPGRFDIYKAGSAPGCVVDNWECIRATSYIFSSTPITPQAANDYASQGFEIAAHITTNCSDYGSAASLEAVYQTQLGLFTTIFPELPPSATNRTHCVVWSDYDTQPQIELAHGIRLDTTYYFWPQSWLSTIPGVFTGSGMPQRFAKADGTMIDVYQAATQMTDESGQAYPSFIETLLGRALGPEGYYGSFVANMHTDLAVHPGSAAIVSSAKQRGIPVISAQQLLDWTDGRNASSFNDVTWNGTALSFKVNLWRGTQGIQAMVPIASLAGNLFGVLADGGQIDYTVERIKGVDYARFFVTPGSYEVRYGVDNLGPMISAITVVPSINSAAISWSTNEPATTTVRYGLSPTALVFSATAPGLATSHAITLTGLASGTPYYYRVVSADALNNSTSAPTPNGTFATSAAIPLSLVDTTVADFAAGTRDSALSIGNVSGGELLLTPAAIGEFTGNALPAGWSFTPWTSGGNAIVSGGQVVVEGALLGTGTSFSPGTLEFVGTFSGHPFQHVGVGTDFANPPWAFFTTGGGGAFYARTNNGSGSSAETPLPASLLNGEHRFRIDWTATGAVYWVDGAQVASHSISLPQPLRPLVSDPIVDGGSVAVKWLRLGPYPTSSVFTSRVMDAQASMTWANATWDAFVPPGTSLSLSARFGNSGTPDTWPAVPLSASGAALSPAPTARFVQYLATFTGDGTTTPVLENVKFTATSAGPTISIADVSVNEGNSGTSSVAFTLKLSSAASVPVSVTYATADDTATADDYVAATGTATFNPGQTSITLPAIAIKGDLLVEGNQTLFLNLTNPVNAQISDPQGVCTIVDNDVALISINSVPVTEGNAGLATATFTVSLSNPLEQGTVTVDWSTAPGTATADTDYASASGTVTFAAKDNLPKSVLVSVIGDDLNEANETFFVNLTNAKNAAIKTPQGTGTITNDDPVVSAIVITNLSVTEGTGGTTNAVIPVSLSKPAGQPVSVTYSIKDVTTDKSDYTDSGLTVTFAPGETLKNISIPITTDSLYEADESFTLTVKSPVNATIVQGNVTVNQADIPVTIVNDDPVPQISINNASVTEGNSGAVSATFTVSLSNPSGSTTTVNYATANGTALAGLDYDATSGKLTFSPGQISKTFSVQVRGDTLNESDENFTVNLTAPVGATIGSGVGTGTIVNDDFMPSIRISDVTVAESNTGTNTAAVLNVTLSSVSTTTVTVKYGTSDGSAKSGADYTSASGTLLFAPGETSKAVTVTVLGDLLNEADETFNVNLTSPQNATVEDSQGVVTITDNDPLPSISINSISIGEGKSGNTTATLTLTLSALSGRTVTVNFATADGTAKVADVDYVASSGTITFPAGTGTVTLPITIKGDTKVEPDETVFVNLTSPSFAILGTATATLTITNDDR